MIYMLSQAAAVTTTHQGMYTKTGMMGIAYVFINTNNQVNPRKKTCRLAGRLKCHNLKIKNAMSNVLGNVMRQLLAC